MKKPTPVQVIVCSRGRRNHPPCSVCGKPAPYLCDYPLGGKKEGKTCDKALCASCRHPQSASVDYCRPHHEMSRQITLGAERDE